MMMAYLATAADNKLHAAGAVAEYWHGHRHLLIARVAAKDVACQGVERTSAALCRVYLTAGSADTGAARHIT